MIHFLINIQTLFYIARFYRSILKIIIGMSKILISKNFTTYAFNKENLFEMTKVAIG